MSTSLKITLIAMTLALAAVASQRQRRFLLDNTDASLNQGPPGSVQGAFSWNFGNGKFVVKDRDAVAEAISDASKESLQIFASLLSDFASEFRVMVALNPNDKHIDLWETAGKSMTDLDDAVRAVNSVADYYLNEMKEALDTADQAEVFEQGLKSGGVVYMRIHRLIPEVRQALTQLIDSDAELPKKGWIVDEVPEKGWVEWVLSVIEEVGTKAENMKEAYQGIIDAAGIASLE